MQININNKYLLAAIPILLLIGIYYYLSDIVSYVIIAWILSMIGAPMVVFLRRFFGKNTAALITLASFIFVISLLVWIFIPPLVNQAKNISNIEYSKVMNALEAPFKDWKNWLIDKKLMIPATEVEAEDIAEKSESDYIYTQKIELDSLRHNQDSTQLQQNVSILIKIDASELMRNEQVDPQSSNQNYDFFEKFQENLTHYLNPRMIQSLFSSTVSAFGNILVGLMSVFFICFFFLREQGLFDNILAAAVPEGYEEQTRQAVSQTSELLIRYFIGILTQVTIITLFVSIALSILGVKNALLIGFFAGFMNIIPYLGPIFGASLGIMITISSNLDVSFYNELVPLLTKVMIVFAITQLLDNIILQPNIFSKSVKAHPLEIFIIVLVGAKLGGILGMVLAIPLYTVLRVVGKVFLNKFKVVQSLTRNL